MRLDPEYPDAVCNLAGALVKTGQNEEAIEVARGAVVRWPRLGCGHSHLGLSLMRRAQKEAPASPSQRIAALKDEGLAHLREAVRLEPAFADARLNLGVALTERDDYEGAIAQFAEVVKLRPQDPDAGHFLELARARLREKQGR